MNFNSGILSSHVAVKRNERAAPGPPVLFGVNLCRTKQSLHCLLKSLRRFGAFSVFWFLPLLFGFFQNRAL